MSLRWKLTLGFAAVTLVRGLPYLGGDFRLDPPLEGPRLAAPTIAVMMLLVTESAVPERPSTGAS